MIVKRRSCCTRYEPQGDLRDALSKCSHKCGSCLSSSSALSKKLKKMSFLAAKSGGLAAEPLPVHVGMCLSESLCPDPRAAGDGTFRNSHLCSCQHKIRPGRVLCGILRQNSRHRQLTCAPKSWKGKRSHSTAWPHARRGSHSPREERTLIPVQDKDFMATPVPHSLYCRALGAKLAVRVPSNPME